MPDYLLLKWGTLKAWQLSGKYAEDLLAEYFELGVSWSAMRQNDTERQKEIICELIDLVDGEIQLDWTGEIVTKEQAKKYVMEHGGDRG